MLKTGIHLPLRLPGHLPLRPEPPVPVGPRDPLRRRVEGRFGKCRPVEVGYLHLPPVQLPVELMLLALAVAPHDTGLQVSCGPIGQISVFKILDVVGHIHRLLSLDPEPGSRGPQGGKLPAEVVLGVVVLRALPKQKRIAPGGAKQAGRCPELACPVGLPGKAEAIVELVVVVEIVFRRCVVFEVAIGADEVKLVALPGLGLQQKFDVGLIPEIVLLRFAQLCPLKFALR